MVSAAVVSTHSSWSWLYAIAAVRKWSLARTFLVIHFAIVLAGVLVTGAWIANQIETSVLDRTAGVTSLYVESLVSPRLQTLPQTPSLSADEIADLDALVTGTALGRGVVVFKIWSPQGQVLYSPDRTLIGKVFPPSEEFRTALDGQVSADLSNLSEPENEHERTLFSRLIEVYAPVLRDGSGQIIAINEFYLMPDQLESELQVARLRAWAMIGGLGALLYLVSAGIVKRGSDTIEQQRTRLQHQVRELATLHGRVMQAANRTTRLHEQALRRITADLHDGPGQVLALALLRLDALREPCAGQADFAVVHDAVRDALAEVRAISSGLRLPELEPVGLQEVIERTVSDHERRSGHNVVRRFDSLPWCAPLAIKIALARTVQEALSNASRHACGQQITVHAWSESDKLCVRVSDCGPGFDPASVDTSAHLGLAGMRERAELLGGHFRVETAAGVGTSVIACWPLLERDRA
jgi:signal transduction histidine kinase